MGQVHHNFDGAEELIFPDACKELAIAPLCVAPGETPFAHSHDCVEEVLIVKSGSGQLEIERDCHEVCAGSVAVVGAGEFHALTNTGDENLEGLVVFNANVDLESLVLKTREEHFGTLTVGAAERQALAELREQAASMGALLGELQEEIASLRGAGRKRPTRARS